MPEFGKKHCLPEFGVLPEHVFQSAIASSFFSIFFRFFSFGEKKKEKEPFDSESKRNPKTFSFRQSQCAYLMALNCEILASVFFLL